MSKVKPSCSPNPNPGPSSSPSHECPTMDILKELWTSFNELWTSSSILGPVTVQWGN